MPDLLKKTKQPSTGEPSQKFDPSIYQPSSDGGAQAPKKRKKSRSSILMWSTVSLVVVVLLLGLGFVSKVVTAVNSTDPTSGERVGFIDQIRNLIANPESQLQGEADDRINILLAGIGGEGHPGSYLADTIIVASIKPSTNEVATMSIPRDLYVEIPDYGWRKINNSLAFGVQSDYPGGGEALLQKVVEETFNIPIHYFARVDFDGFRQIIDDLGGIEILVDNSFVDYQYPDYNYGYQVVSFETGLEVMDGERALQYSRSRHGTNGEGSDFARSQRQQKVLLAIKEKFFSVNTLLNPASIVSALDSLGQHNQTNMQVWEIVQLAKMSEEIQQDNIITLTLDTSDGGYLQSDTTLDGAYILRPTSGSFDEIQYQFENIFNTSFIAREQARIEIQNGTNEVGLATTTADQLKALRYNVVHIGNADTEESVTQTTIYDLSGGANPYTLVSLKNSLNARIAPAVPTMLDGTGELTSSDETIDILIILGSDQVADAQLTYHTTLDF